MHRTSKLPRRMLATGLAACAHLLVLLLLGWRIPRFAVPAPAGDEAPPIEVTLIRPALRPRSTAARRSGRPASAAAAPSPRVLAAPAPGPSAMAAPAPTPEIAVAGPADCEPEDLPLLTEDEKARCRNQIDADKARRAARGADARLAQQVAKLKAVPRIDNIPAEKRAYYDAVAAAYDQQSHGPPMAGRLPGPVCGRKPAHGLKLGPLPCYLAPPQGFLTEESGLDPLDPQWRRKK